MGWYIANQVPWLIPGLSLSDCDLPSRKRLAPSNAEQELFCSWHEVSSGFCLRANQIGVQSLGNI
jgi:hypothetical protein